MEDTDDTLNNIQVSLNFANVVYWQHLQTVWNQIRPLGSKQFDTLIVFLKNFFEKVYFQKKKISRRLKSMQNYSVVKELRQQAASFLSANALCRQFGPRSGLTKCQAWSRSNLFDALKLFWKNIMKKVMSKNICRRQKIMKNYLACQELWKHMRLWGVSLIYYGSTKQI